MIASVNRPRPFVTCFSPICKSPAEDVVEAMVLMVLGREAVLVRLLYIRSEALRRSTSESDVQCDSARNALQFGSDGQHILLSDIYDYTYAHRELGGVDRPQRIHGQSA